MQISAVKVAFWRDTAVDGGFADSATTLAAPAALRWHFATSCILLRASVFSTQLWLMQVWCQGEKLGRRIPAFNFLSHESTYDFMGPFDWLGAPKPSPHSLCCVSMTIMKPLVFIEFHFLSQLVFSWLRPYASFSSATTPNRRRPARSSRSLLGLQFFWHFRLKRRIAMPAVPDQRSRRVCSACACVFVFCVREQSQASHQSALVHAQFVRCRGGKCGFVGCAWAQRVFGAAESSAHALSVSAKCVLKRVCSECVLMHISLCAQCKYVLSWWLCVFSSAWATQLKRSCLLL